MNKKTILIIILTALISIILILILTLTPYEKELSPKETNLVECKSLNFNSNNGINLVFFSPKEEAEKYMHFFLATEPFDKKKEAFNFYYIETYKPKCELYKGIAILCHSKELLKVSASCPNDYIVVLKEENPKIRSSSYQNVLSINTNHPMSVLSHEFGHSFANLAEEYTPANLPLGVENCVEKCELFNGEKDGCFQGCSKNNYFRSIENGVMRTLSSNNYGIFNKNLILKRIPEQNNKITGRIISENECHKKKYILIEGRYIDGKIEIINKELGKGCPSGNGAGPFNYKIKFGDVEIRGDEFNPEFIFTDAQNIEENEISGETFISDREFILKIPQLPNAEILQIFKENEMLTELRINDVGVMFCRI
ncbi:MAG: hypothetical protein QW727_00090 [Candidatus Pacearchaeota archaeon]